MISISHLSETYGSLEVIKSGIDDISYAIINNFAETLRKNT